MKIDDKKMGEGRIYSVLIVLIAISSVFSLFGGIMEPDGALYASIAKNIVLSNDWISLYVRGQDWLDKPHLTFWLAAGSFKIFGINDFAYKLPSLLINWLGCYYLFLLGLKLYDRKTALIAVIIYITAFHVIISNFDVRAEIYLSTFTLAAVFHYYLAYKSLSYHIIIGSFFLACGIMVKGIFVIIPIFSGFIFYWILTKQYKELLKIKWWLAVLLVGIFIVPELYTLYVQFDAHPEKTVFDRQDVSGIRFFFWDSQFGRFFNTGPITGKGDPSFFLHTVLWAFLPWSVLLYTAIVNSIKNWKNKGRKTVVLIIYINALVAFLLFSFSKFQLPHYIIIIFPHFALLIASYLMKIKPKTLNVVTRIQHVIFFLVIVLLMTIALIFNFPNKLLAILLTIAGALFCYVLFSKVSLVHLVARNAILSLLFMLFSYGFFYPALLQYQAGMCAGLWLKKNYPHDSAKVYGVYSFAFDFYAPGDITYVEEVSGLEPLSGDRQIVFLPSSMLGSLRSNYKVKLLKHFDQYHISKLKLDFINYKTRSDVLTRFSLVELQ